MKRLKIRTFSGHLYAYPAAYSAVRRDGWLHVLDEAGRWVAGWVDPAARVLANGHISALLDTIYWQFSGLDRGAAG